MKKLIEKIIEKLEEECFLTTNDDGETNELSIKVVDLNDAIEIVKQAATEHNNGWIPCDGVHFPEENVYVRVTTWTETEKIGFRRDGKWFVYGSDGMAEATVLAWQPTQPFQPKGE